MPSHHLPDELLLAYANGGLVEAEQLLVAVHASLCARCASKVGAFEALGGAQLEQERMAQLSDDLLARTLGMLDSAPAAPVAPALHDSVLTAPLARFTGPLASIQWKQALPIPNVFFVELPLALNGVPVLLRRFRPGTLIPMHAHRAEEYDLILTGGLTDHASGKHFVRGDVSMNDESVAHHLNIDQGDWCIALSVHASRAKPLGLLARFVFGYTGW
jgi:putative transcriptional regulator